MSTSWRWTTAKALHPPPDRMLRRWVSIRVDAAESTYDQLSTLYADYGQVFAHDQLGVTVMIGVNDITTRGVHHRRRSDAARLRQPNPAWG